MSWASATQNAPAQRIPAWKRLGLKLKGDASGESPTFPAGSPTSTASLVSKSANKAVSAHRLPNAKVNGTAGAVATASTPGNKRKQSPSYANTSSKESGSKRLRVDDNLASESNRSQPSPKLRRQKFVTFSDDTKPGAAEKPVSSGNQTQQDPQKKKTKKKKKGSNTSTAIAKSPTNIEPSLSYLRQWHVDRSSWKFNKNHQTLLIKYVFDAELLPSSDIATFYAYIRDIKGFVRTRLREAAQEVTKQDMEKGTKAFPASVKDADTKQAEYEKLISGLLPAQQQRQNGGTPAAHGRLKRTFDEADFVSRTADLDIRRRALKRMRAEVVLDELSDSDSSSASSATATTASSSSSASADREESAADAPGEKRVKLNDGSQRRVKRRRKLRSAVEDEDSSSESESDTSSSSSRSSSSSEESEDDGEVQVANGRGAQESSSSSSSSSSESDSGSDGDTESDDAESEGADEKGDGDEN